MWVCTPRVVLPEIREHAEASPILAAGERSEGPPRGLREACVYG